MRKHRFQNLSIVAYTFVVIVLTFLVYAVGSVSSRIETLEYVSSMHSQYNSMLARRSSLQHTQQP